MSSRSQRYGFQSATMVQPANGGLAYVFGNNGSENDLSEEDGESYELRSRGKERLWKSSSREKIDDIIYLTRDIQEGDTLNSLALQYHCSVADIKRANNLLTELDFFALRSVKIPVRRFSVLTETHSSGPLKPGSPTGSKHPSPISPVTSLPTESSTDSSTSSTDSVEGFLLEKDKDIEQLVKSTGPSRSSLNEVVSSLTQQPPLLVDPEYKPSQRKDPYYGADWGMRWWTAVAIMLVVGIITPVFYLLYYEVLVKSDVSHHGGPTQAHAGIHLVQQEGGKSMDMPLGDKSAEAGAGHAVNGDPQNPGDVINLGDRQLTVLHMPGHSRGSICLHDRDNKLLFSGDVVYDGSMIDWLPYSQVSDYISSCERLVGLVDSEQVDQVLPGHYNTFGAKRLHRIASSYISRAGTCPAKFSTLTWRTLAGFALRMSNPHCAC